MLKHLQIAIWVGLWTCASVAQLAAGESVAALLDRAGVHAGFFVHVGAGDGTWTAELKRNDATLVHGLEKEAESVAAGRRRLYARGAYGDIALDHWDGGSLPYVDNLINLLIVENPEEVERGEILRALAPHGVAMVRRGDGTWEKIVKPRPKNIDQWTHYLHDPSGNAVADDDVVGPPRHLQWVGSPRWSRHHDRMASMSALVSAGGRMFYIMDEGSRISILLPPKWKLIARDAFNGTVLWKRDIPTWQSHLWPLKSGPTQLARRLVADDDRVFVTLGYDAPAVALDARNGQLLVTYEDSDATEEIIRVGNLLFLVVRKGIAELADYAPMNARVGDQAAARNLFWNEEPRVLMAFDVDTGKRLWAKQTKISPLTLAADGQRLYFHDGRHIVAVDGRSGEPAWESTEVTRRASFTFNFGPRLVVYQDVVLFAGGDGKMYSLDAASGEQLWTAEHPKSGYQSPQDLIVMDGLVWCAPTTSGKDSGVYTGRDPRTGEVQKEFPPDVDTYWFHHRCYIAKATKNYIMPSRTGIEFVDPERSHWDIHHWVRGGCLYGIMPCNGLTYAPPHDCACYPEAKLYGFNALAPSSPTRPVPKEVSERGRLERGPAYDRQPSDFQIDAADWPTFRHDNARSGMMSGEAAAEVEPRWETPLGGRLTQPVIAAGRVFVGQTDAHALVCLDARDGSTRWTFLAGGRIDSPPTIADGRAVFGCADGYVYCLDARDGMLMWRYRAAPMDRRTMAFEQLESLWPVHGSVLVRDSRIYCVAGRSIFLDGGLRLVCLDLKTGRKLSETILDERNPETGNNIQEKLQVLQMPVGLPDILSCDDRFLYMKSQKFDWDGNRLEIGPNSGDFVEQVLKQRGPGAHIFAPMGFLDDSWFHRSYWVLGQSFAGGHGGYYQAGRVAPSGRILVQGNGYVFGYGRKPEYLRWTTTLEHQLFAADPNPPEIPPGFSGPVQTAQGPHARFPKSASLDPSNKPITVEAWFTATRPAGVLVARGGPTHGFVLHLKQGQAAFGVRADSQWTEITGGRRLIGGWHHVVGVLREDRTMELYVDGALVAEGKAHSLIPKDPAQGLEIGADQGTAVGNYNSPNTLAGIIDEVRLYFEAFPADAIARRFADNEELADSAVLVVPFDDGSARDMSLHRNNGTIEGARIVAGKFGRAVQVSPGRKNANGGRQGNTLVQPKWAQDVPIYVRAMALSGVRLFIVGPPDIVDEEEAFQHLSEKDPKVQELLAEQDAALQGAQGALLLVVNIDSGEVESALKLDATPAWDGLSGAQDQLFLSTSDGRVVCLGALTEK